MTYLPCEAIWRKDPGLSSSSSTSPLLSPSLIYFNLSCFTFPLRERACWWAVPYRPRNCVCALAVMKHLDAAERDGYALILVVFPSSWFCLPLQKAWTEEMSLFSSWSCFVIVTWGAVKDFLDSEGTDEHQYETTMQILSDRWSENG